MSFVSNYVSQTAQSFIKGQANALIYGVQGTQIIQLYGTTDAIINENHQAQSMSSEYSIETGATLTDHLYIKPKQLTVTCYVSSILQQEFSTLSQSARDNEAFARFIKQQDSRSLVSVVTTIYTYDNMYIANISAPKDSGVGSNNLVFDLTLKETLLAQTSQLPNTSGVAKNRTPTKNNGSQQSTSIPPTQYESVLYQIL